MARFDILIQGGKIVDGTGSPWRRQDLAVHGGKIVDIGKGIPPSAADEVIHAPDLIVAPGFVDAHSHADITLLADQEMEYRIMQGITTEVVGQDGLSYAPVGEVNLQVWRRYLKGLNGEFSDDVAWTWRSTEELLQRYEGKASNAVHLVPHGAVRVEVMGWADRPARADELSRMQDLVIRSLEEGAAGLSTGLTYIPCSHASTDEMIALCTPVGKAGGILSIHLRSYGAQLLTAVEEAITIGRKTGAGIHISHLRMADPSTWGLAGRVLDLIDRARKEGVDVTFDIYPYTVGCAPAFCLLPPWAQHGGPDAILNRLRDSGTRARISEDMDAWSLDWSNYSLSNAPHPDFQLWEGRPVTEAAAAAETNPFQLLMDVLLKTELDSTIIAEGGSKEDNLVMLKHPAGMIGSDGVLVGGHPHPRGFGTYPRLLTAYVRDNPVLRLEEAVRKMTAAPAGRHQLLHRGTLTVGSAADVVVFSLEELADHSTFQDPRQLPQGMESVLINGRVVVREGKYLGSTSGRALRPLSPERRKV